MIRLLRSFALLLALLATVPAHAWWDYGHQTVATIAMHEVRPATRAAIRRLLARSDLLATPACPARTIEQAAVWADCVKQLGDRFRYAYAWHFQDVDICKPFDLAAPCADGNCVSVQIERMKAKLADRRAPLADRVQALVFLVHLVGDLAQPLHAGEHHDKGGNDVPAAYGVIEGRASLHLVWDGLLADRAISTPPGGALGILRGFTWAQRRAFRQGTVEDWSRESWQVARDTVYPSVMPDPCGAPPVARVRFDEAQVGALTPVLRLQVARGGMHLARLLDEALG